LMERTIYLHHKKPADMMETLCHRLDNINFDLNSGQLLSILTSYTYEDIEPYTNLEIQHCSLEIPRAKAGPRREIPKGRVYIQIPDPQSAEPADPKIQGSHGLLQETTELVRYNLDLMLRPVQGLDKPIVETPKYIEPQSGEYVDLPYGKLEQLLQGNQVNQTTEHVVDQVPENKGISADANTSNGPSAVLKDSTLEELEALLKKPLKGETSTTPPTCNKVDEIGDLNEPGVSTNPRSPLQMTQARANLCHQPAPPSQASGLEGSLITPGLESLRPRNLVIKKPDRGQLLKQGYVSIGHDPPFDDSSGATTRSLISSQNEGCTYLLKKTASRYKGRQSRFNK